MSMELIDSNKLIDYFFYGIDEKPITGSTETDEKVIQVIQSQETVKAIPLEVVEQIKNRLEKMPFYFGTTFHGETIKTVDVDKVIKMLDETIKEQDE